MNDPEVSVVVVTHRSAGEAAECVASLRRCFAEEGLDGEVILVDCGSGAEETRRLEGAGADLLLALPENRGYSGGVNSGLARARSSRLLLSNADVVFRTGSVRALAEAIGPSSVGAAAPLAFWDADGRIRLPPGFAPGFWRDIAQLRAGRRPARDARRFASFARETLSLWESGGNAPHLSGAVLAVRRDVFDRVGRFDERYPFEYEETEWQDRARSKGLALAFVPRARVRHRWGSSAAASPDASRRRAESRRLYWRSRYGRLGGAILDRAVARPRAPEFPRLADPRVSARAGAWLAISTNPSLLPFAATPLDRDFRLPDEIAARLPAGPLYLRVFRGSDGWPVETFVWEKE